MDADLSHAPHYISQFASCMLENDMVIGSRLISGGKILERKKRRNLLTWAANIFIRRMLNIPVYDCTSGYRCFNIELLNKIGQQNTMTNGPANLTEVLYYAHQLGAKIKEVPIIFADRQHGQSKLTGKELMESVRIVFRLRGQYAKL